MGARDAALDSIATAEIGADPMGPEGGIRLDFLTQSPGLYLTIQPPGISMGAFEVPTAGISLNGQMYVIVNTNHSDARQTDRSVLTRVSSPVTPGDPDRVSSVTHDLAAPGWEVSQDVATATPWGPWSDPQLLFNARNDGALGRFIHDPGLTPDDGLAGPVIGKGQNNPSQVHGGAYAPYMIERWTRVRRRSADDGELDIYYVLSTWNAYVVVLMTSRLRVSTHLT